MYYNSSYLFYAAHRTVNTADHFVTNLQMSELQKDCCIVAQRWQISISTLVLSCANVILVVLLFCRMKI